jgi:hypothetical protein
MNESRADKDLLQDALDALEGMVYQHCRANAGQEVFLHHYQLSAMVAFDVLQAAGRMRPVEGRSDYFELVPREERLAL